MIYIVNWTEFFTYNNAIIEQNALCNAWIYVKIETYTKNLEQLKN